MRRLTESLSVLLLALPLAAGALAACATSPNAALSAPSAPSPGQAKRRELFAGGAAGIAALARRNPHFLYRSVSSPSASERLPQVPAGTSDAAPERAVR